MTMFLLQNQALFLALIIGCGFAFSQYVVLKAGVFSIATAGFASLGAYAAGILAIRYGLPAWVTLPVSTLIGAGAATLIAIPLARLRGVFQGLATLAFVQIIVALNYYFSGLTGGPMGLNGIPNQVGIGTALLVTLAVFYILYSVDRTRLGATFDALRQNESAAAVLGISVGFYHTVAFALSGAIGGLYGGMYALSAFAITPEYFGFHFMITVLAYVIFGGRASVFGPVVGAVILLSLPELFRPFAEHRLLIYGATLILVITRLPEGVVDTLVQVLRRRAIRRTRASLAGASATTTPERKA